MAIAVPWKISNTGTETFKRRIFFISLPIFFDVTKQFSATDLRKNTKVEIRFKTNCNHFEL